MMASPQAQRSKQRLTTNSRTRDTKETGQSPATFSRDLNQGADRKRTGTGRPAQYRTRTSAGPHIVPGSLPLFLPEA